MEVEKFPIDDPRCLALAGAHNFFCSKNVWFKLNFKGLSRMVLGALSRCITGQVVERPLRARSSHARHIVSEK
jgi:hypothetical protein